jgi:hypothetical protein
MDTRSLEKWGWWGGWFGAYLWLPILSIASGFRGDRLLAFAGTALFVVAVAAITYWAPWRHPTTRYWKLMLPCYLGLVAGVALVLSRHIESARDLVNMPYTWTWLILLILPMLTIGKTRWDR